MGLFFPDNDKRQTRVTELYTDCQTFITLLSNTNQSINTEIENLNAQFSDIFKGNQSGDGPKLDRLDLGQGIITNIVSYISPFVAYPVAKNALSRAAVSYLLTQGRIGEAALAPLVGLPTWFKWGARAGGILAVIGISLAIDAIDGAVQKSNLVDAIQKLIQPRIQLQLNVLQTNLLENTLGKVSSVVSALQTLNEPPEKIQEAVQNLYNTYIQNLNNLTEEKAKSILSSLDSNRSSFTDNDY